MPTKCNKSELNAALMLKVNTCEVQSLIYDTFNGLKPNYGTISPEHFSQILDEKVSKQELHFAINTRLPIEEF